MRCKRGNHLDHGGRARGKPKPKPGSQDLAHRVEAKNAAGFVDHACFEGDVAGQSPNCLSSAVVKVVVSIIFEDHEVEPFRQEESVRVANGNKLSASEPPAGLDSHISLLRSSVHTVPVGLDPVGTVYKTDGRGSSTGHSSKISKRSEGMIPSPSVLTATSLRPEALRKSMTPLADMSEARSKVSGFAGQGIGYE
jgi:hypothetical protein